VFGFVDKVEIKVGYDLMRDSFNIFLVGSALKNHVF
jgi:hypothetical protein